MIQTRPHYFLLDACVRYFVWLIAAALFVFALSSCAYLGIATEDYVEQRVEAVNEHTASAAEKVAESADAIIPGFAEYVGETFRNEPTRPPPVPDEHFPWLEVIGIVGAAFGVSVPAAVKATNMIRDNRRVALGEPTKAHPIPEVKAPEPA